jgi:hypothetical protein
MSADPNDDPWKSPKGDAAGEVCPVWPDHPLTAHWGVADPVRVKGPETQQWLAFRRAFRELENRIKIFTSLPLRSLDRGQLKERLDAIGRARVDDPRQSDDPR